MKIQKNPTTPATTDLPVIALNSETFPTFFEDNSLSDILIFFTAPACFSCDEVFPIFEETVSKLHKYSSGLKFGYIDLGKNELQDTA